MRITILVSSVVTALVASHAAHAMCGCMLAPQPKKGETAVAKIINKSSEVVLARDGDTTVLTMANEFEGAPAEFGMVVPVPTVIKKDDVHVVDDKVLAAIEAATAPRITEVYEPDPCGLGGGAGRASGMAMEDKAAAPAAAAKPRAADYGVKIESHFFAGEYEIAVLSGTNSNGLVAWLQLFHYDVPDATKEVLGTYIKQKMMFFVARVYLKEMGTGPRHLRPIQVRYTTPKLMLPIRLGMVNADGPQELTVFVLTKAGRVEPTNYRTVKMPTGSSLPLFAKADWSNVYSAMFAEQTKREDMRVVFLEHAQPIFPDDNVKKAGAFWPDRQAFATRLHFKYAESTFPEDLVLQVTNDNVPFGVNMQAIHPATASCGVDLSQNRYREQQTLANLTGWGIDDVMKRAGGEKQPPQPPKDDTWYKKLWK